MVLTDSEDSVLLSTLPEAICGNSIIPIENRIHGNVVQKARLDYLWSWGVMGGSGEAEAPRTRKKFMFANCFVAEIRILVHMVPQNNVDLMHFYETFKFVYSTGLQTNLNKC